ncbi:9086_t:CDS:2 [Entrophospora sp. SA101]|nr:9086_t:CDS:2 [Entrophospora sp. SA101]
MLKFETIIDMQIAGGKMTEAEKNQAQELCSLFKTHTKEGNLFAIAGFADGFFEAFPEDEKAKIFPDDNGLTYEQ